MPRDPGTDRRRTAHCARVAACAALGRDRELAAALRAARRGGVPVRALRETLLQVHLFAGFPRTVNALAVLEGTLGPLPPGRRERLAPGAALRRGRALFGRVYGADAGRVLGDIGRRHPEFRDWILAEAYGKVLGRPGISAAARECIAVALLAVLDLPRQRVPHERGALRCGASPADVAAALAAVRPLTPPK
jgi:alkylhydroperoxidase/carboxymuconolactone decarboxylase family protein YurZ